MRASLPLATALPLAAHALARRVARLVCSCSSGCSLAHLVRARLRGRGRGRPRARASVRVGLWARDRLITCCPQRTEQDGDRLHHEEDC